MASQVKNLLEASIAEKLSRFRAQLWDRELSVWAQEALRQVMESTLQRHPRAVLGIRNRYEHSPQRRGHCNSYYKRRWILLWRRYGCRCRGCVPLGRQYGRSLLGRYQRRMREVDEGIAGMFLREVSTRAVARLLAHYPTAYGGLIRKVELLCGPCAASCCLRGFLSGFGGVE